jgi:hypothetical protein
MDPICKVIRPTSKNLVKHLVKQAWRGGAGEILITDYYLEGIL